MNVNDLRAQKAELVTAAQAMTDAAIARKKDLAGNELVAYNAITASIRRINDDLNRHASQSTVPVHGLTRPNFGAMAESSSPTGSRGSFNLREMYARASSDEREQIDGIAAYLGGREISANADLRPSSDGGLIIPSFVVPAIERNYAAFAPVVSAARVWGTETGTDTVFPVLSDTESAEQVASAAATGADATVSGDTPPTALTGPMMSAYKISSKPTFIPRETFSDSPVDVVTEVVGALLARIIRFENLRYTKGTGSGQAEGYMTNSTPFAVGAVALDLDIALDLAYSVPALYRPQGVYMMTDTTAKYLRKLKTGVAGSKEQLWADADATKGTPATLHGYPVLINNDADDVSADGTFAGKSPIVFGDFSKFVVRQVSDNSPYAYRYQVPAKDGAAVILFRRSDSRLLVRSAISKLVVA
ncbi:MAG: phage major capsid protein [Acidobacteriaceae bacterium]|nr:phage major capsid protein [Acidobacteriaceae bacterium]